MNNIIKSNNTNNKTTNKTFELISEKDLTIFTENSESIMDEAVKMRLQLIEPYESDIIEINNLIIDYIKQNKRKIYGGFALNLLLKDRDPKAAIYKDNDIPDIDFYSPEPLKDIIKLCNLIYKKGYKDVRSREAMHKETYSIKVRELNFCDISYIPRNIYNRMPFREIDGFYVTGAEFMIIDYYRLLTDLLLTSWRLEKTVNRLYLLQKYYPMYYSNYQIKVGKPTNDEEQVLNDILQFMKNNNNTLAIGLYAYNHFLNESGIIKTKRFRYVNVSYYEIIMTDYRKYALQLIDILKDRKSVV